MICASQNLSTQVPLAQPRFTCCLRRMRRWSWLGHWVGSGESQSGDVVENQRRRIVFPYRCNWVQYQIVDEPSSTCFLSERELDDSHTAPSIYCKLCCWELPFHTLKVQLPLGKVTYTVLLSDRKVVRTSAVFIHLHKTKASRNAQHPGCVLVFQDQTFIVEPPTRSMFG